MGLAAVAVAWYLLRQPSQWSADTYRVYDGIEWLIDWIRRGCKGIPRSVGPFPLFQYLTGLPVVYLGKLGIPLNVFSFWTDCSAVALLGLVWLMYRSTRTVASPGAALLAVVVILSGPLIIHVPWTDNELPAAFLTLAFALAVTGRSSAWSCAALFWLVSLTKEIAIPLLMIIWIAGAIMRGLDRRQMQRHGVALLLAAIAGLGCNMGFNLLRYGHPWNIEYMADFRQVHQWSRRLENVLVLWFSPSGGVITFWPTWIGFVLIAWRANKKPESGSRIRRAVPAIAVAAVLALLTTGLACWYMPLGWWGWGPRLMLPWLPACLAMLIRGYPDSYARAAELLLRHRITFIVVLVLASPHVLYLSNPGVVASFFKPDSRFSQAVAPQDVNQFFAWRSYLAWQKKPPLLVRPMLDTNMDRIFSASIYLIGLMLLLNGASREVESARKSPCLTISAHEEYNHA